MEKDKTNNEKFTTQIHVTGIPVTTKIAIDKKADKQGITTAGYIKNLINLDLKADKMDNYNNAG